MLSEGCAAAYAALIFSRFMPAMSAPPKSQPIPTMPRRASRLRILRRALRESSKPPWLPAFQMLYARIIPLCELCCSAGSGNCGNRFGCPGSLGTVTVPIAVDGVAGGFCAARPRWIALAMAGCACAGGNKPPHALFLFDARRFSSPYTTSYRLMEYNCYNAFVLHFE